MAEQEIRLSGRIIAPGEAFGYVHLDETMPIELTSVTVPPSAVPQEVARLEAAMGQVRRHLEDHVRGFHGPPTDEDLEQVLAAHQLILDDRHFFQGVFERIEQKQMRAERAVEEAFCATADRLAVTRDAYLRARTEDLRDVCLTLQVALARGADGLQTHTAGGRTIVVVATNLHVSSVLRAKREGAVAYVTSSQAYLSHGAILLRAAGIPSVGGVAFSDEAALNGRPVRVDALHGEVVFNPIAETRPAVVAVPERIAPAAPSPLPPKAALTADGTEVALWANIDNTEQAGLCLEQQLNGIGLFRTEFLVLSRGLAPDEEEQCKAYQEVIERLAQRPLVLRTFDLGADKGLLQLQDESCANPALGARGLRRHLLRQTAEFRTQLRAILRATVGTDAAILLPMVTHAGDLQAARQHLEAMRLELELEGKPHNDRIRMAAMVEIPAAALSIDDILGEADFVSVGTNDLTQYICAADRNNASVSSYLRPESCGLMVVLEWLITRARALGRVQDVFVCGEMASDPQMAAKLVKLGYRGLVVTPQAAGLVREAIGALRLP